MKMEMSVNFKLLNDNNVIQIISTVKINNDNKTDRNSYIAIVELIIIIKSLLYFQQYIHNVMIISMFVFWL